MKPTALWSGDQSVGDGPLVTDGTRGGGGPLVTDEMLVTDEILVADEMLVADDMLVTDQGVPLVFTPAGLGSRALAAALDVVVVYAGVSIVLAALGVIGRVGLPQWAVAVVMSVVGGTAVIGYPIVLETWWNGRTLGKAAAGIRVVTRSGGPVGFRQAALRAALLLIDVVVVPVGFIGVAAIVMTRRSMRLGDLAAGTMVVRDRRVALTPARPLSFWPPAPWHHYASTLDVGGLDPELYGLVRSYLLRVGQLRPEVRAALAAELGEAVVGRMAVRPPAQLGPEPFLVCVAAAYQQRFRRPVPQ